MKGWRYALLIAELFLFALILVLPQVDLPDFTFPGGTAPIAARSKLSSPPVFSIIPSPVQSRSFGLVAGTRPQAFQLADQPNPLPPATLSPILRC